MPQTQNGAGTDEEILIAVMGVTGAGKSYFIREMTGKDVKIGHTYASCTQIIKHFRATIDGMKVCFIDTPGFNDQERTDVDVLKQIGEFMKLSFNADIKLSGIIYLHSLVNTKMDGASMRSLHMFRKLCGDTNLKSVMLATTQWGEVNTEKAQYRQEQLHDDPKYWKEMIQQGAYPCKFTDYASGLAMVKRLAQKGKMVTQLQRELVHMDIAETAAGQALSSDILALQAKHKEELAEAKAEMLEAMKVKDEQTRKEMMLEATRLEKKIQQSDNELARLHEDRRKESRDAEIKLNELIKGYKANADMEKEAREKETDDLKKMIELISTEQKRAADDHSAAVHWNGALAFFSMTLPVLEAVIPMVL